MRSYVIATGLARSRAVANTEAEANVNRAGRATVMISMMTRNTTPRAEASLARSRYTAVSHAGDHVNRANTKNIAQNGTIYLTLSVLDAVGPAEGHVGAVLVGVLPIQAAKAMVLGEGADAGTATSDAHPGRTGIERQINAPRVTVGRRNDVRHLMQQENEMKASLSSCFVDFRRPLRVFPEGKGDAG